MFRCHPNVEIQGMGGMGGMFGPGGKDGMKDMFKAMMTGEGK